MNLCIYTVIHGLRGIIDDNELTRVPIYFEHVKKPLKMKMSRFFPTVNREKLALSNFLGDTV